MELIHNQIPVEFVRNLPEGMKLLVRHGRDFLVVERIEGPTGVSLMSEQVRIHGEPSIRLDVKVADDRGRLYVDSFWGSHAKLYSFVPSSTDPDLCVTATDPAGNSLMATWQCDIEGCTCTSAIALNLPVNQGRVLVCARLGCPGHRLELAALDKPVSDSVSSINYFGAGTLDDEWFDSFT